MNIAILAVTDSATMSNELSPAIEAAGGSVDIIDYSSILISDLANSPLLAKLGTYDLIYYRSGFQYDVLQAVEAALAQTPAILINLHYREHPYVWMKTAQVLTMSLHPTINIPKTLHDPHSSYEEIAAILGTTFVAKANHSSQGREVHLITNKADFAEILPDRHVADYFFQEYIAHAAEYRVHMIENEPIALYKRIPPSDDFRSNVSVGATMHPVEPALLPRLEAMSKEVQVSFGFEICALDFMFHDETQTFYFTEINRNPGWEYSDMQATGVDLSIAVASYFKEKIAAS